MNGITADWNGTSIDKLHVTAAWLARLIAEAAQARQALIRLAITLEQQQAPDVTTPAALGDSDASVSQAVNLVTSETNATIMKLRPDAAPAAGSASTKVKPGPAKATRSMSAKDWQVFRRAVRVQTKARGLDDAGLAQAVGLAKSTVEAALGRTKPPRDTLLVHFQKWMAGGDGDGPPRAAPAQSAPIAATSVLISPAPPKPEEPRATPANGELLDLERLAEGLRRKLHTAHLSRATAAQKAGVDPEVFDAVLHHDPVAPGEAALVAAWVGA